MPIRGAALLMLGLGLLACSREGVRPSGAPDAPPIGAFFDSIDADPITAAALGREILTSPLTDDNARRRVVTRWTQTVVLLEALRDARLADAEALLAQGAVLAADEAVREALELEAAVGMKGSPRSGAELRREVEWARTGAQRTAQEASGRARAAMRAGDALTAAQAAAEARSVRQRAGLAKDLSLAVVEGLALAALPDRLLAHKPLPEAKEDGSGRPTQALSPPRRRTQDRSPHSAGRAIERTAPPLAERPTRSAEPVADLAHGPDPVRAAEIQRALALGEAAYAAEDLESAHAHWQQALSLDPANQRAQEGLSLYRRFAALKGQ